MMNILDNISPELRKVFNGFVNISRIFEKRWTVDRGKLQNTMNQKNGHEEYEAYDRYFYGNPSFKAKQEFNYAWLHHIHHNSHHWQYWVLQNDDDGEEVLEMPYHYVVEMICDWWSFSWSKGNLDEIFEWYEKHKDMKLHPETRKLVEEILGRIKKELENEKETSSNSETT